MTGKLNLSMTNPSTSRALSEIMGITGYCDKVKDKIDGT
jgi:hypothetical protein